MNDQHKRFHPNSLWLDYPTADDVIKLRDLPRGYEGQCAGTDQRGMDNQVSCAFRAKRARLVAGRPARPATAHMAANDGYAAAWFPVCGSHARRRGIFVVPSSRLVES